MKKLIRTDSLAGELSIFLKAKADSLVNTPQEEYKNDKYGNILFIARSYAFRLTTLSTAYRIFGEQKYADAVNQSLLWVCKYPDWSSKHYLDTSELSTGVAIAYDWLFDVLPTSTKEIVRKSLYERAISIVLNEYKTGKPGSWAKRETNWNVVCNAGMTMAALAVAEDYPEEAKTILTNAAKYIPNCMKHFAPDGVCYEGPAYWGYTTSYLSVYLKAVMDNGGDKGGISMLEGIPNTALFYKRTLTPGGQRFNFGNASNESINSPAFFLFGKLYNQPEVSTWYRNEISKTIRNNAPLHQLFFLALPWYDSSVSFKDQDIPPMEIYHNSINDLIVINGDRKKEGSIFLIAKGGEPKQAHQQMDCGTFIIESDSVCWSEDLGADDYSLPGFWDYKQGGKRWTYFRNNNLSHNTISINKQYQNANGKAFVCEEKLTAKSPSAKLDMSSLYPDQATSVFRKFSLKNDHCIEIEDEINLTNPQSEISWIMASKADIHIIGKKAHLKREGKEFYIEIITPKNASFITYPAKNNFDAEYPITGINMLEAACKPGRGENKIIIQLRSR
ncbi:MAG: heparinase II/III domain-containing protein [Bacteroidales bacterium]